jgi:uncharacterized protein YebE (UPF0316 family)
MNWEVVLTCFLIVIARVADVALGTLRTVFIVNDQRLIAWVIGFIEVLIWVVVVSKVVDDLSEKPVYAVCYALGFALGTYLGMTVERRLAVGEQVVRIFTHNGRKLARIFRTAGFGVTLFDGEGMDGPIQLLFIEIPRRKVPRLKVWLEDLDPDCYYIIDDIRFAGPLHPTMLQPTGWRAVLKRK